MRVATLEEVVRYGSGDCRSKRLLPPIMGAAGFTWNQAPIGWYVYNSTTQAYTGAITAGDFLFCVFVSAAYNATTSTITGVSDNVNGAWTVLENTGSISVGANGDVCLAFAYFENSAAASAGAMTVTINGYTANSGNGNAVIFDLGGAATSGAIVGSLFSTTTTVSGSSSPYSFTTPSVTDSASGDLVLGIGGSYDGAFTAGSGATLEQAYSNGNSTATQGVSYLTANSANGSNSVNGLVAQNARDIIAGTVIVKAAGGSSVSLTERPSQLMSMGVGC